MCAFQIRGGLKIVVEHCPITHKELNRAFFFERKVKTTILSGLYFPFFVCSHTLVVLVLTRAALRARYGYGGGIPLVLTPIGDIYGAVKHAIFTQ